MALTKTLGQELDQAAKRGFYFHTANIGPDKITQELLEVKSMKPKKGSLPLLIVFLLLILSPLACNLPTPTPSPCSVDYLIYSINNANDTPATTDIIDLDPGCIYKLESVNNILDGDNGLPSIMSPIIIHGNDAVITRSPDTQELFRIFHVSGQGDLSLEHVVLKNGYAINSADNKDVITNSGGAIFNRGNLTVTKSAIKGNQGREGGGIFNAGNMEIIESTIQENQVTGAPGGAGLYNMQQGNIRRSAIILNGWDGIFNCGDLEIINSTISGNSETGIDNEGDLLLQYVTIAYNEGSGLVSFSGNAVVQNSIFGLNGGGSGGGSAIHPQIVNMTTDGAFSSITVTEDQLNIAPLGNYGGITETHALLPGSMAIDAALRTCPPTDQRYEPRPYGLACDLGAYEYTGEPLSSMQGETKTPTPSSTPSSTPSATATPTITCTPEPRGKVIHDTLCWFGPGSAYNVVSSLFTDQIVDLVGVGAAKGWLIVDNPRYPGVYCWTREKDVEVPDLSLLDLPVIAVPATPTPPPTATATPTSEAGSS